MGRWVKNLPMGTVRSVGDVLDVVSHPVVAYRQGWNAMSPIHAAHVDPGKMTALTKALASTKSSKWTRPFRQGLHLDPNVASQTMGGAWRSGGIRGVAEELSRQGWTGKSQVGKYLPLGGKGLTVGFIGLEVPSIVRSQPVQPTGEHGAIERGLGALGGTAAFVAGASKGFFPSLAVAEIGRRSSAHVGRVLDRLRAGASMHAAVEAPSPSEARRQLQNLQRYYG